MKAYITCPVTQSKERLNLLPEIEKIVKSKGIETFVFKISNNPKEIFKRDYEQLKSCDIIIAEVSEPSHGVGIEIGISYCLGLKIILLQEKGKNVTKLAEGIPNVIIIEYENAKDLKDKLNIKLQD
jgi:2'-deoxynucleoside 5'-phosphate N-hydrolase